MADTNQTPTTLISLENLDQYTDYVEEKNVIKTYQEYSNLPVSEKNSDKSFYISDKGVVYRKGVVYGDSNIEVDDALSETSENPVQNKILTAILTAIQDITYTLSQDEEDGHVLIFTPSTGTATRITIPDNDHTYTDLNQFSNENTQFITNAVSDLVNYYTKSQTYTQAEVNQLISAIPKFKIEVVDSLLIETPSTTTIYLVRTGEESQNLYTEYIYLYDEEAETGSFEKLGTQTVDLSGYYTSAQVDSLLADKVNTADIGAAATKGVDTTITDGSTSINLPTSEAVASFVEGKGYVTTDNDTTYTLTADTTSNQIILTPSSGSAQSVTVPFATHVGIVATPITYNEYRALSPFDILANNYLITDYPFSQS